MTIEIHLGEKRDVFLIAMIGITGDVARGAALHFADGVREAIPDGFALAAFVPRTLDLVRGGCGSPDKFFGKLEGRETPLGVEQSAEETMAGRQNGKARGGAQPREKKFAAGKAVESPAVHLRPPG